jgi:hypothetical protein
LILVYDPDFRSYRQNIRANAVPTGGMGENDVIWGGIGADKEKLGGDMRKKLPKILILPLILILYAGFSPAYPMEGEAFRLKMI